MNTKAPELNREQSYQMTPKYLIVEAAVRYWEDASVNGHEDTAGTLIPFRSADQWCPKLELETGRLIGWPQGTSADIHYKVCDKGNYWLADSEGDRIAKWNGVYVPNELLCIGDDGCGDYISLRIDGSGAVQGWRKPRLDWGEWELLTANPKAAATLN